MLVYLIIMAVILLIIVVNSIFILQIKGQLQQNARNAVDAQFAMQEYIRTAMRDSSSQDLLLKISEMKGDLLTKIAERNSRQEQDFSKIEHFLKETQSQLQLKILQSLREMSEEQHKNVEKLNETVQQKLQNAVEQQMQTSFQRVMEQINSVQNAVGEMRHLTENVSDLKRLFGNIKTKGGWGEAHCQAVLDDILPAGSYLTNHITKPGTRDVVEFAVRMPLKVKTGEEQPLLPIDSKFPTTNYELLLQSQEEGDREREAYYRKELEKNIRFEAKKIHDKYIHEPVTVNFAILYLPTDGLYFEVARMPSLIADIGRDYKILIMGPSLLPALLKTISLGYITLALEDKSDDIRKKLTETLQEVEKIDKVFDGIEKHFSTMDNKFKAVRTRTRAFGRILRGFENGETQKGIALEESMLEEYDQLEYAEE